MGRILLNLNVASGAFYDSVSLTELWDQMVPGDLTKANSRTHSRWEQIETICRNVKFYTKYFGGVTRQKTFWSFCRAAKPQSGFLNAYQAQFDYNDGRGGPSRTITVAEYFKERHNVTLRFPSLPVINIAKANQQTMIPAELAECVVPCQPYRRQLLQSQKHTMIQFAARKPFANAKSIAGDGSEGKVGAAFEVFGLTPPKSESTSGVKQWGLGVNPEMVTIPARVLATPAVVYAEGKSAKIEEGAWNTANQKFHRPGTLRSWDVIILDNERAGQLGTPLKNLEDRLTTCSFDMPQRPTHFVAPPTNKPASIKKRFSEVKADIFLIVLGNKDKLLYPEIKRLAEVEHGVQTICCEASKLIKNQRRGKASELNKNQRGGTFFANLALKFNLKTGGMAHKVTGIPEPFASDTMIMGIDVTHPSPDSADTAPSIAAVIASTTSEMCNWPGSVRAQTRKVEMIKELREMCKERLHLWQERNQKLPAKVIVYRDGVSEGQYEIVQTSEISALKLAFEDMYPDTPDKQRPKLTVIIVGKRHHSRFFPTSDKMTRSSNCVPGTVVDRGITQRGLFEFYLQSHAALQGTARPAHYVVIKDENCLTTDNLQQFTYQLCHLFHRATKAVSICPPAYYADLLAERGRCYLHRFPHTDAGGTYDFRTDWTGKIHDNVKNTTWYV